MSEAADRGVLVHVQAGAVAIYGPLDVVWDMYPRVVEFQAEIAAGLVEAADGHPYVTALTLCSEDRYFGVCVRCQVPWEMHGRPEHEQWRLISLTDRDASPLAGARSAVAAVAAAICARCSQSTLVLPNGLCPRCLDETA